MANLTLSGLIEGVVIYISGKNVYSVFGFSFKAGHASDYFTIPGITDFV